MRPALGPMGQLLRELKVLRSYAPFKTDIIVVFGDGDEQAVNMLDNEGFVAMSETLLGVLKKGSGSEGANQ